MSTERGVALFHLSFFCFQRCQPSEGCSFQLVFLLFSEMSTERGLLFSTCLSLVFRDVNRAGVALFLLSFFGFQRCQPSGGCSFPLVFLLFSEMSTERGLLFSACLSCVFRDVNRAGVALFHLSFFWFQRCQPSGGCSFQLVFLLFSEMSTERGLLFSTCLSFVFRDVNRAGVALFHLSFFGFQRCQPSGGCSFQLVFLLFSEMLTERGLLFSTCLSLVFRDVNLAGVALFHLSFFGFQRCQPSGGCSFPLVFLWFSEMSTERGLLFSTCLSLVFRDVNRAGVALFHLSFFGFQRCQPSWGCSFPVFFLWLSEMSTEQGLLFSTCLSLVFRDVNRAGVALFHLSFFGFQRCQPSWGCSFPVFFLWLSEMSTERGLLFSTCLSLVFRDVNRAGVALFQFSFFGFQRCQPSGGCSFPLVFLWLSEMSTERGLLFSTCLSLAFRDVNLAGVALFHLSFFGFQRCQPSGGCSFPLVFLWLSEMST